MAPTQAAAGLLQYGALGVLVFLAVIVAIPALWWFLTARISRTDSTVDKKDAALLDLTRQCSASIAVNNEVIKQNSSTLVQVTEFIRTGNESRAVHEKMLEQVINEIKSMKKAA